MQAHADDDDLWMVLAVIQPFRLDAVTLALEAQSGFGGMTVSECRGFGREKVTDERTAGATDQRPASRRPRRPKLVDFTDKGEARVAVAVDQVDAVIDR